MNWNKTSEKLPCEIGWQNEVVMWSDGWATWLKGSCTRFLDGSVDWCIFDQLNDKDRDLPEAPEYWMHISLDSIKSKHIGPGICDLCGENSQNLKAFDCSPAVGIGYCPNCATHP